MPRAYLWVKSQHFTKCDGFVKSIAECQLDGVVVAVDKDVLIPVLFESFTLKHCVAEVDVVCR
jgi:hypothetical protein